MATKDDVEKAIDPLFDAIFGDSLAPRRERIATAALTGLLTNAHHIGFDLEVWSRDAVKAADALIAALDATKDK